MKNFVQPGVTLTLVAPYDVNPGDGLLVGSLFGYAKGKAASGSPIETLTEGVVDGGKAAGAVTQGAKLYWDNTAKVLTTTASGNTQVGVATQAAASGDATARIKLGIVA